MVQGPERACKGRELENSGARMVGLGNGGAITRDVVAPPGRVERPWRSLKAHGGQLQALIQQLVQLGIQDLPEGTLESQIIGAVERELIEQVLARCKGVQGTAAKRLGMNRNTLHKKVRTYATEHGSVVREPPTEQAPDT